MGKTKIKTIDDSSPKEQESRSKKQASKKKAEEALRRARGDTAKSEVVKASGAVERITESEIADASGAKQTSSERLGRASDALQPDELSAGPRAKEKPQKPGKAKPRSKKYQEAAKDLDRSKSYPIDEAVDIVKKMSYAKFNATIEAHINTAQTGLRGLLQLPYASGRKLRILVFGPSQPQIEGVVFGTDSTLEEIEKGQINFNLIIATAEWMPRLAKVARVLGPKGLMPNPKNGTITDDLKKTVESFRSGKTEYKTEAKAPVIHLALGKLDQPTEELSANVKTLLQTLGKGRIKKVSLSPTMGPSVKVDLSTLN